MAKSQDDIISDIEGHIAKYGGSYSDWYVGITEDAKARVFGDHGVVDGSDPYIWRTAVNSAVTREIEAHFLELDLRCIYGDTLPCTRI